MRQSSNDRQDDAPHPQRLGPYRLLALLGRGSMGAVYLARRDDEQYERRVAIKILRAGLEHTEHYHRFLAERQILARLDHPGIARLYDGGSTEDGRPYLVMELVEGLPVDEYCDRHRLTVDQRLRLFLCIGAAVQHAHQHLLVHRDLKPGNILVSAEGEPKLLDFGIAKELTPAAGAASRTRTGLRVMTLSHASPEQVEGGAITTASDVYSLGVLLYQLLAGRSPYPVAAAAPSYELERAIHGQEPEKPGKALWRPGGPSPEEIAAARGSRPAALGRRLTGDLDTIVLTALQKEPSRRYESVARLCSDLERHLKDLPISARPDHLGYRLRKLVRRHRAGVAAAAAAALLVTGFVARLLVQERQTLRERDKARYALSFLVDTFKQAALSRTRGEKLTVREILDRGTARIGQDLTGEPDVLAEVTDVLGEIQLALGHHAAAEPLLTRSLALRRQLFGPGSLEVADSLEHLGRLHNERLDWDGGESHLRQALAIRRRLQDGDVAVAKTLNRLGDTLVARGISPQGAPGIENLYREALAIARRAEGPEGRTVAETLLARADFERARGSYAEAERLFQAGLALDRKVLGERDPRFWRHRARLGITLLEAGKLKEAEAVYRQSLEVQRELLGREHPDVASSSSDLAVTLHLQGRYAEAEALEREVLALARSLYGPTHGQVGEALCNLAASLMGQGRRDEAIPLYEDALAIRRRAMGEKHWQVAQILLLLAEAHRLQKELPEALELARQAYDIFAAVEGPDHPYTAHALQEIGRNYVERGRFTAAEPFLRRSLSIRQQKLGARHPDRARSQIMLARCLIGLGRDDEARGLLLEARATFLAVYGPDYNSARQSATLLAEIEARRTP